MIEHVQRIMVTVGSQQSVLTDRVLAADAHMHEINQDKGQPCILDYL